MADWNISAEQRVNFGEALHSAMELRRVSQTALKEHLGTSQSVISQWRYGKFACPPAAVFEIEDFLDLPAGWLSQHLGYTRLESVSRTPTVEEAIGQDPDLSELDKRAVLALLEQLRSYQAAVREAQEAATPRRAPAKKAAPKKAPAKKAAARTRKLSRVAE